MKAVSFCIQWKRYLQTIGPVYISSRIAIFPEIVTSTKATAELWSRFGWIVGKEQNLPLFCHLQSDLILQFFIMFVSSNLKLFILETWS